MYANMETREPRNSSCAGSLRGARHRARIRAKEKAHLTDLQHPWHRIRKAAGLNDVRIHDLRHTFASGGLLVGEGLAMNGRSGALDCFAPLAMTLRGQRKPHPVIARSTCDEAIQSSGVKVGREGLDSGLYRSEGRRSVTPLTRDLALDPRGKPPNGASAAMACGRRARSAGGGDDVENYAARAVAPDLIRRWKPVFRKACPNRFFGR
jgi:hypothetical protein